jgi:hypothetical protein
MEEALAMTFPYKAIPSKAAIASEELSCSRPCGLSSTERKRKCVDDGIGAKHRFNGVQKEK